MNEGVRAGSSRGTKGNSTVGIMGRIGRMGPMWAGRKADLQPLTWSSNFAFGVGIRLKPRRIRLLRRTQPSRPRLLILKPICPLTRP